MKTPIIAFAVALAAAAPAFADEVVDHAKAVVAKLSGPQTEWSGPTSAPKPGAGKRIVYLSGDENNDICRLYGVFMGEATPPNLKQIGYVEHEYVAAGTATSYKAAGRMPYPANLAK